MKLFQSFQFNDSSTRKSIVESCFLYIEHKDKITFETKSRFERLKPQLDGSEPRLVKTVERTKLIANKSHQLQHLRVENSLPDLSDSKSISSTDFLLDSELLVAVHQKDESKSQENHRHIQNPVLVPMLLITLPSYYYFLQTIDWQEKEKVISRRTLHSTYPRFVGPYQQQLLAKIEYKSKEEVTVTCYDTIHSIFGNILDTAIIDYNLIERKIRRFYFPHSKLEIFADSSKSSSSNISEMPLPKQIDFDPPPTVIDHDLEDAFGITKAYTNKTLKNKQSIVYLDIFRDLTYLPIPQCVRDSLNIFYTERNIAFSYLETLVGRVSVYRDPPFTYKALRDLIASYFSFLKHNKSFEESTIVCFGYFSLVLPQLLKDLELLNPIVFILPSWTRKHQNIEQQYWQSKFSDLRILDSIHCLADLPNACLEIVDTNGSADMKKSKHWETMLIDLERDFSLSKLQNGVPAPWSQKVSEKILLWPSL
ncbi:MAG: hypothetical protein KDD48_04405 [Bdellovibrionales bacterium]|nr:hypothetical protein [Bdellovibrionales bacterium]